MLTKEVLLIVKPIRVLHAVVNMNRGGAETLLMNLYRNIDRTKVQFDFLTCKEGVFDEEIKQLGGKVHRIPYVTDKGHFGYIKALNQFFAENKEYHIIHSHMDKMSGIVLREAKRNKIPVRIAHSHNTSSEGSIAAKLYKWYAGRNILSNSTHHFACSSEAAKWLFHSKAKETTILKNGIESEKFSFSPIIRQEVREELGLNNDFVIGHVGRFNHQKNHSFLIDLFSKISKAIPDAKLLLVGDGELRIDMEKKVTNLGLDQKVFFLGVRSDIHRLLQGFDLFLFPSLHEGLPVTLIEAQGAGLPCIISDAISREVDMGLDLIKFVSLEEKESIWINEVKKTAANQRSRFVSDQLMKNGYDIKGAAAWTEEFYLAN